jgi:serine/threonine-protein kinase
MGDDSWPVLSRLLDEALELVPAERARWMGGLAPEHHGLLPRLGRLLAEADSIEAFLDTIPKVDETAMTGPDDGGVDAGPCSAGPYLVERKLAEGGMGSVWLARRSDGMVKRPVALKLPRGTWPRAGLAERMVRERDILAALNHPNIARLYDAGLTSAGQPYLALEFVPGRRIDEYADAERLSVRARLQLFLQVARAVAHAHARLIVHRDLKPSNVLVTDAGEVKLLDFGIAKLLDEGVPDTAITEASGLPLTPDYASPEQITGAPLSTASDVYSLGVLLYELLTGVRPYTLRRDSRGALEDAILQSTPRRPSDAVAEPSRRRTLRGDLDTIVLKALKKEPAERYETVNAFAEDIERHLHGHAVLARPDRVWYRLSKFVARNTIAVAAAAAVLAVTVAGAGLVAWQARVAVAEKVRAEEVRDFLMTIFREASPYNGTRQALSAVEWLKHVKDGVDRRFDDRPELRVELLNLVGMSLLTLQDTAAAEVVLTQAVQEATRRLGADHLETLRARVLLTPVYRFRGQTKEMGTELDRLLPLLRAKPAAFAEHLVVALKNKAHLEIDEGRYAEAERAAREALDVGIERLGDRHPETVAAFLMVALTYQFSRSAEAALLASERAYRIAIAAYPGMARHPRVIEGRLLYGRALAEAGRLAEGVEQLTLAVEDAADVFGPSSRMVGFFSVPLSTFQLESGEITEALDSSRRAVDIIAEDARPESFRYAAALHARGAALLAARRADEALPDLTRAVEIARQALTPLHDVTRTFAAEQALALAWLGRHEEAEHLVVEILPRDPHSSSRSTARLWHVLGVVKRLRGEYAEALRLQQQARESMPDGASALERMNILKEIGLNLQELARPAEASTWLEQALALSRRAQTRPTPDRADTLVGLGRARMATGRLTEAVALLREADRFWRDFHGENRWASETALTLLRAARRG